MSVLLTGGAGFIGSHMAAKLLTNDIEFIVVDNLSNSDESQLQKLEVYFQKKIPFYQINIGNEIEMRKIFKIIILSQ